MGKKYSEEWEDEIMQAFSNSYFAGYRIDLKNKIYYEIIEKPEWIQKVGTEGDFSKLVDFLLHAGIDKDYHGEIQEKFSVEYIQRELQGQGSGADWNDESEILS